MLRLHSNRKIVPELARERGERSERTRREHDGASAIFSGEFQNANAGLSAEKFTLTISLTGKRVSVDFERCVVAALSSSIVLVKKIR